MKKNPFPSTFCNFCSFIFIFAISSCHSTPPGRHWPRKGVWGCAAVMTPFFQASQRSLAYQFTIIAPLLYPPFSNFRKVFNFQPCFGQNFSSQDPNFRSLDPSFFKENPLPRPYFWKPVWHTPTKKKVECPPGLYTCHFFIYMNSVNINLHKIKQNNWKINHHSTPLRKCHNASDRVLTYGYFKPVCIDFRSLITTSTRTLASDLDALWYAYSHVHLMHIW